MRALFSLLLIATLTDAKAKKKKPEVEYDVFNPMKVDFTMVTPKTFERSVGKYRSDEASQGVLLYYDYPMAKEFVNEKFQPMSEKLKNVVSFTALDCQMYEKDCVEFDPEKTFMNNPVVLQVPPYPRPMRVFPADMEIADVQRHLLSAIPKNNVTEIKASSFESYISTDMHVPKIVLFTDKPRATPSIHAIANSMKDRLDFAFVNMELEGSSVISSRAKVTKYPALAALKAGKWEVFPGDIKNPSEVFDWVNVRSETFVKGGGYSDAAAPEAPFWTTQSVPELTKDSNGPVCFKQDHVCGIYVTSNAELSDDEISLIEKASAMTVSSTERDPKVKFSFLSTAAEPEFIDLFNIDTSSKQPQFMLFRPGKNRFSTPAKVDSVDSIVKQVDDLKAGNQRFSKLKVEKLPFRKREEALRDEL